MKVAVHGELVLHLVATLLDQNQLFHFEQLAKVFIRHDDNLDSD